MNGLLTDSEAAERLTNAEDAILALIEYGRSEGPARKAFLARKAEIEAAKAKRA